MFLLQKILEGDGFVQFGKIGSQALFHCGLHYFFRPFRFDGLTFGAFTDNRSDFVDPDFGGATTRWNQCILWCFLALESICTLHFLGLASIILASKVCPLPLVMCKIASAFFRSTFMMCLLSSSGKVNSEALWSRSGL